MRSRVFWICCLLLLWVPTVGWSQINSALGRRDAGIINPLDYGATCTSTTLNAAIAGAPSTQRILMLPPTDRDGAPCIWAITATVTIPRALRLMVSPAAQVLVSAGILLTVGAIDATCHSGLQWINAASAGSVKFVGPGASVCPQWWGASDTSTEGVITVGAINLAINSLSIAGGEVFFPSGTYLIAGQDGGRGIWVKYPNITLRGVGRSSILQAMTNDVTVICVGPNSSCSETSGTNVANVTIRDLNIQGIAPGQYSPLLQSRGILGARVTNLRVHDTWVSNMSMEAIAMNSGNGEFSSIHRNQLHNNYYAGIQIRGPASQTVVADNVIAGIRSVGFGFPSCIQVTGHVTVTGNTCYDTDGYGILHGPANYYGITVIANNLIKKTAISGIKANNHGAVQILGNTIINAGIVTGFAGIELSGDTLTHPIPVPDSLIANNLIINSAPAGRGIVSGSPRTSILGNKIVGGVSLPNTTATAIAAISDTGQYTFGIQILGANQHVADNTVDGAQYALAFLQTITSTTWGHNTLLNISGGEVATFNNAHVVEATFARLESTAGGLRVATTGIPSSGHFWSHGSEAIHRTPASGQPKGWVNISHVEALTTSCSGTTLNMTTTTGLTVNHVLSIVNQNGDLALRHRTIASVNSGTQVTLTASLTCVSGEVVRGDLWTALPNVP